MSASLVGSEMCIRDSRKLQETARSKLMLISAEKKNRAEECRIANSNAEPVSYTHLTLPTICSV
eukprot:5305554-Alexandrium_andersonii.AAC.1